jgi:hypothetical protein
MTSPSCTVLRPTDNISLDQVVDVFLGGTCNGSAWRDLITAVLPDSFTAFDPQVKVGEGDHEKMFPLELRLRDDCELLIYVLTPLMDGFVSPMEIIADAHRGKEIAVAYLGKDKGKEWPPQQLKSLKVMGKMVNDLPHPCHFFGDILEMEEGYYKNFAKMMAFTVYGILPVNYEGWLEERQESLDTIEADDQAAALETWLSK